VSAYLEVCRDDATDVVPLDGVRLTVGRGPSNDIDLDDPTASRRHAVLERLAAGWSIDDVGSLNGTLVNGTLLARAPPLYSGDEIVVGDTRLIFHGGDIT
jgi:pSer/pThr/pTyr-binding forkhead associated (FHA) protein